MGNYWDNYTGYDDDFDGIGDTPHNFGTGIDYLPIWNFQSPIHIDDSATGAEAHNWTWAESQLWCSGSGNFSAPYIIEGLNISARGVGNGILIGNSSKYFIVRNCILIEAETGTYDAGIHLEHVGNGTLINNNCSFNNKNGIYLYYSGNTTVSDNTVDNNEYGIYLDYSDNNTVSGNTAKINNAGIFLDYSDNNTVSGNTANDNGDGIYLDNSDNNTVSGNTAKNNNAGLFLRFSDNNTVSGNTAMYNNMGIFPHSSYNTTVLGNSVDNNYYGIYIYSSFNTTVSGNTVNNNQEHGIYLYLSGSTTILGNIVDNNVNYGIYTRESDYNLIYKNYLINNGIHALDEGSSNNWNSSIIGNYWDNYTGYDNDLDGIGDSPHNFGTGIDYLPIWNFQSPIHIDDSATGVGAHNWTWAKSQPWCSGSGMFSAPYIIEGLNITARGGGNGILIGNSSKYFIVRNCKLIEAGTGTYNAGIHLEHVGNGTLINNNCSSNNKHGIYLGNSDNNTVSGNTVNNNQDIGIRISQSNSTTVSGNIVDNNVNYGIIIISGCCNLFYNNYFNDNNINAYDNGTDNEWDNGIIGNHWDDYAGVDANDNGIGDTPYIISGTAGSRDNFPIWADGDSIAPVITIILPSANSVFGLDAPSYQITIVELNLDTIWYTLDGGGTNYIFTNLTGTFNQLTWEALSEGNFTIRFYANDTAGNIGSADVTVGKDISAPVITIILPLTDSVFDLVAPYYNISIDELNLDTIWYTLDGGITNYTITGLTGTFNQLAWEALTEGSVTIRFYAKDTVGYIGFIDVEVIIEIPEDLTIISFGNYYLLFTFITILSFIILEKRKKK